MALVSGSGGFIDVCHGDADGICALRQMQVFQPRPGALLITGSKREINLLARVKDRQNALIRVLDISLDVNRDHLLALLAQGNHVFYADHHFSGEIPASPLLEAHINTANTTCTALIIDGLLNGLCRPWAIVGAFGDNLEKEALSLAASRNLNNDEIACLRDLGHLLNYNAYALEPADQYAHPAELCHEAGRYDDPLCFSAESSLLDGLRRQREKDMEFLREDFAPFREFRHGAVFLLPSSAWARRISGLLANRLAREFPERAHAVLSTRGDGQLLVSVRAPLLKPYGADTLCRQFLTGGGRAAAAGINVLPRYQLETFLERFNRQFSSL